MRLRHALGVLARLSVVFGVHLLVVLALSQRQPHIEPRVEPILVSVIAPPVPEPVVPAPEPVATASRVVPAIVPKRTPTRRQSAPVEPASNDAVRELPAAVLPVPAEPATAPAASPDLPPRHASAVPATAAAAAASAPLVPPRFDAAYLNNPRPEYPRIARRMGEHGKVILRVYVAASGRPERVEIRTSSGSPRLDQAARVAVERWQFVPARQGEEAIAAWVLVPITFVLEG